MSDAPVHYDVTRIALIDALGNLPLGEHLCLEPRARMADALLAQMPVASPDLLALAVQMAEEIADPAAIEVMKETARHEFAKHIDEVRTEERERAEAEHSEYLSQLTHEMDATLRAERDRIIVLAERCGATCQDQNGDSMPFADAIREQS